MSEFYLGSGSLIYIKQEYATYNTIEEKYKFLLYVEKELRGKYKELEEYSGYNEIEQESNEEIADWLKVEFEFIRKISQIDNPRLYKILSGEELNETTSVSSNDNPMLDPLGNEDSEKEIIPPRIKWLLTVKQLRLLFRHIYKYYDVKITLKNIDILIHLHFVDKKGNKFKNNIGYNFDNNNIRKIIWPGIEEQIIYLNMELKKGFIDSEHRNTYSFITDHFTTNKDTDFDASQLSKVFNRMQPEGKLIKKNWFDSFDNILNKVKNSK